MITLKFYDGVIGIELEPEYIQLDDLYIGIFNIMAAEGSVLAVASTDKYLITTRLSAQIERLVTTIERLSTKFNL